MDISHTAMDMRRAAQAIGELINTAPQRPAVPHAQIAIPRTEKNIARKSIAIRTHYLGELHGKEDRPNCNPAR
eukprot:1524360-Pleurochrysis_carterae.AAC.1